jgi:hypothetical protein
MYLLRVSLAACLFSLLHEVFFTPICVLTCTSKHVTSRCINSTGRGVLSVQLTAALDKYLFGVCQGAGLPGVPVPRKSFWLLLKARGEDKSNVTLIGCVLQLQNFMTYVTNTEFQKMGTK